MWLAIVVHLKTPQERPSFSVYNYRIFTYDCCKRKMRLDLAGFLAYNYRKSRYNSCKLIIYSLLGPWCSFTTNVSWVAIVVYWHFLNDCAIISEYKYRKSINRSWKLEDASTHKSVKTDGGTGPVLWIVTKKNTTPRHVRSCKSPSICLLAMGNKYYSPSGTSVL